MDRFSEMYQEYQPRKPWGKFALCAILILAWFGSFGFWWSWIIDNASKHPVISTFGNIGAIWLIVGLFAWLADILPALFPDKEDSPGAGKSVHNCSGSGSSLKTRKEWER